VFLTACGARSNPGAPIVHDVVIRHGLLVDGTGGAPRAGDLALDGDKITAVGDLGDAHGRREIDAAGLAVAPGFINMLSHSEESLIEDGRSQGEIREGVTLEVLGESSMGPLTDTMRQRVLDRQEDIKYDVKWTTLGGYLDWLVARGISTNVASFVGAGTLREYVVGLGAGKPTPEQLGRMVELVDAAMTEGALGVTTALQYPPDAFADTADLVALAHAAASRGGSFAAHMRNEGDDLDAAIDEMIAIAKQANVPVEIYHFKQAGRANWGKLAGAVGRIDAARAAGLQITADMYTYIAAATSLGASLPPKEQQGEFDDLSKRLSDPAARERIAREMNTADTSWDNAYAHAGADGILLVDFKSDALRPLTGKTLAAVARDRGKPPEDTLMDLIVEDRSMIGAVYFMMDEANVAREMAIPWMSFCSDAASMAPEGAFIKTSAHPRAYGNFARLLGRYVRDQHVLSLEEAVRRLTSLPAHNLHLAGRGQLAPGYAGDVVVFDPQTIADHATFERPHQYSTGMAYVLVNGVLVIDHNEHTDARPGRVVRGPGYRP
jgi:N-acyl-D-amino-acid deacylase